jgi:hypothetical protein
VEVLRPALIRNPLHRHRAAGLYRRLLARQIRLHYWCSGRNVPRPPRLVKQDLDRKTIVHRFASPTRRRGVFIYVNSLFVVGCWQLRPIRERSKVIRRNTVERLSVGLNESECAIVEDVNLDSALVDHAVVETAERDKVQGFCFSTVGPVLDVVRIAPAGV